MTSKVPDNWGDIIDAIKTPLGFLALGILIVTVPVATLAILLPEFSRLLVWAIIILVALIVITVVCLAVWRPEALRGDRPLHQVYANQFACDLYLALDGPLRNLEPLERAEAWLTVADVVTSGGQEDASYSRFSEAVAKRLKTLANLNNRSLKAVGPIES